MKAAEMTQPLRGAITAAYNPQPRTPNRKPLLVTKCNNAMCGNECHVRPLESSVDWQKQERIGRQSGLRTRLSAKAARSKSKKGQKGS